MMSAYTPTVTLGILHSDYGQMVTLRRTETISKAIDRLRDLPSDLRRMYHLSFENVWLGETVTIAEVCLL
jgi:hypothetical protein